MLCAYMLLVIMYVVCIHVVGDYIYVVCIYVVGEIFYMRLVVNCWCTHVLEYNWCGFMKLHEVCIVVVES